MITLTFFKLHKVYIKKVGQIFFHIYLLTYLKKDTSVLLKVINIWTSYKSKAIALTFSKYCAHAHNPFNKVIKSQKKKNTHSKPYA